MKKRVDKSVELINLIYQVIYKKNLVKPGEKILIGLSGGQDSISLLFVLFHLQNQWDLRMFFMTCNHLWQIDSFESTFNLYRLSYYCSKVFIFSVTPKIINSEQKSRIWREKIFQRLAYFYKITKILTAHTATDSFETFLLNLFRGTSKENINSLNQVNLLAIKNFHFSSLDRVFCKTYSKESLIIEYIFKDKSILLFLKQNALIVSKRFFFCCTRKRKKYFFYNNRKFSDFDKNNLLQHNQIQPYQFQKTKIFHLFKSTQLNILLIRPLLSLTRYDLKQLVTVFKLPIYPDITNTDMTYRRNRIRKQILPFLRFFFNNQIDNHLFQVNQLLEEENQYFRLLLNQLFIERGCLNQNQIEFDISILYFIPTTLRKRCIRYFFKSIFHLNPNFFHINFITNFLDTVYSENNSSIDVKGLVKKKFHYLFFPQIGCLVISGSRFILYK